MMFRINMGLTAARLLLGSASGLQLQRRTRNSKMQLVLKEEILQPELLQHLRNLRTILSKAEKKLNGSNEAEKKRNVKEQLNKLKAQNDKAKVKFLVAQDRYKEAGKKVAQANKKLNELDNKGLSPLSEENPLDMTPTHHYYHAGTNRVYNVVIVKNLSKKIVERAQWNGYSPIGKGQLQVNEIFTGQVSDDLYSMFYHSVGDVPFNQWHWGQNTPILTKTAKVWSNLLNRSKQRGYMSFRLWVYEPNQWNERNEFGLFTPEEKEERERLQKELEEQYGPEDGLIFMNKFMPESETAVKLRKKCMNAIESFQNSGKRITDKVIKAACRREIRDQVWNQAKTEVEKAEKQWRQKKVLSEEAQKQWRQVEGQEFLKQNEFRDYNWALDALKDFPETQQMFERRQKGKQFLLRTNLVEVTKAVNEWNGKAKKYVQITDWNSSQRWNSHGHYYKFDTVEKNALKAVQLWKEAKFLDPKEAKLRAAEEALEQSKQLRTALENKLLKDEQESKRQAENKRVEKDIEFAKNYVKEERLRAAEEALKSKRQAENKRVEKDIEFAKNLLEKELKDGFVFAKEVQKKQVNKGRPRKQVKFDPKAAVHGNGNWLSRGWKWINNKWNPFLG